jgi:hypothetical protein
MNKLVVGLAVCVGVLGAGCSTPLSLRGARVLEPGEVEVLFSPQVQVPAVVAAGGGQSVAAGGNPFGWAEASARFGLIDRLDLQLRLDPSIIPEASLGYQLVGDPARNDDFALTVTAGLKPSFLFVAANFNVPVQVLVEAPLNDTLAFTGGLRVIPSVFSIFGGGNIFAFAPGVVAGVRFKTGNFVLQPEVGLSSYLPVGAVAGGQSIGFLGQGFVAGSVAATVGLNIGGQFDFRPPQPPRAPEATQPTPPADTPAPAPAPIDQDPAAPPPPPAAPY